MTNIDKEYRKEIKEEQRQKKLKSTQKQKLKVAFCFSGQLRTWKDCICTWNKLFNYLKESHNVTDIDIFCHFWDHNTLQQTIGAKKYNSHKIIDNADLLSNIEINNYLAQLAPVDYRISNTSVAKSLTSAQEKDLSTLDYSKWMLPQYYSIMYSAHLKRMHEVKHNFKYDTCVRMRNDLYLTETFNNHLPVNNMLYPKFNTVYSCHTGLDESQWFRRRLGDIFWYADSPTFDKMSNFYQWLSLLNPKQTMSLPASPEHLLYFYAKMFNILIESDPSDPKIARDSNYVKLKQDMGLGPLGDYEIAC